MATEREGLRLDSDLFSFLFVVTVDGMPVVGEGEVGEVETVAIRLFWARAERDPLCCC